MTIAGILLVAIGARAAGQPIACTEDEHCSTKLFCEAHICKECLKCEDLNRQSPPYQNSCVKSETECGPCFIGMVERRDESGAGCATSKPDKVDSTQFIVAGTIGAILLCAFLIGIIIRCKWKSIIKKNLTSIHARIDTNLNQHATNPTAPNLPPSDPPPYSEGCPLMKLANPDGPSTGFENVGVQEAVPSNGPNWVRGFNPDQNGNDSDIEDGRLRRRAPSPADLMDETTAPDVWRPGDHYDRGDGDHGDLGDLGSNGGSSSQAQENTPPHPIDDIDDASGMVPVSEAAAADSGASVSALAVRRLRPIGGSGPPAKLPCLTRADSSGESNNNGSGLPSKAITINLILNNVIAENSQLYNNEAFKSPKQGN